MKSRRGCKTACTIAVMVFLATSAWGAAGDKLWETEFTIPNYSRPEYNCPVGYADLNNRLWLCFRYPPTYADRLRQGLRPGGEIKVGR